MTTDTSPTTTNTAAWINAKHAQLEVGPATYTPPEDDQIVIRNHAVAINPLDWIIQVDGNLSYRWLNYPTVLGSDVAGEVVEVATAVTRFRSGDRVLGHAVGTDKDSNSPSEGVFQHYTVVLERMSCPIPHTMPFEDAAVLPIAVSTASCGLFQTDHLGLRHPSVNAESTGETVLVWGGSTSVGSNAIQLAAAAGYEVITTRLAAQLRLRHLARSLTGLRLQQPNRHQGLSSRRSEGARLPVRSPSVPPPPPRVYGSRPACTGNKFVSIATPPVSFDTLAPENGGRFVGHGIHEIQRVMDAQLKGVSAAKVVVTLP